MHTRWNRSDKGGSRVDTGPGDIFIRVDSTRSRKSLDWSGGRAEAAASRSSSRYVIITYHIVRIV